MKRAMTLLAAVWPLYLLAAPEPTYLKQDMTFTQARSQLLKHGWVPVPMHLNDGYRYDGVEKELVRRRFMEVDSCSNDSARCVLYYRKAESCLRLDTIGEHVRSMKVVRWTNECAPTL